MSSNTKTTGKWLSVQSDQPQCLNSLPNCLTLCDLKCDNYYKLIAVDFPKDHKQRAKLKIFKGTGMVSELGLPGMPSAVESFYIEEMEPKIPIVAVAIGESILFYRNLKPYFKYTLPEMTVELLEQDIWRKLVQERSENQDLLIESLKTIDISQLTNVSQKLLRTPTSERDAFIRKNTDTLLHRYSTIVAMKALQRASSDYYPSSSLVIASENGEIIIIDTQSFGIIYNARVCSFDTIPSLMAVQGQYETDFRIVIASRDGSIFLLRKSWLEGQEIFKLNFPPIGMTLLPIDQTIVVASMDKQLTCYSKKGKQLHTISLTEIPICLTPVHLPHLGMTLICVSLKSGLVQFYLNRNLVDEFHIENTVIAMIFGHLGQEEYVLTLVTENGSLLVKILKRIASFDVEPSHARLRNDAQKLQDWDVLKIPKKSSIFVEQSVREKDNAKAIYGSFQVELWRLRLTAARSTVEAINSSESTISGDLTHAPIKLSAEVCGLGPQFRLFLIIENMSTKKVATNLSILLHANQHHYQLPKAISKLPILVPGIPLKIDFEVNAVLDTNDGLPPSDLNMDNAIVRIMIIKAGQAKPLLAAVVAMPASEAPLEN